MFKFENATSGISKKLVESILSSEKNIKIPDNSTMNRWYNGKNSPPDEVLPFIAEVLGVDVDDLRVGKKLDFNYLENEINKLTELLISGESEKSIALALLSLDKYSLNVFTTALLFFGILLLNHTYWDNVYISAISFIIFIGVFVKDTGKYYKDQRQLNHSFTNFCRTEVSSMKAFLTFCFQDNLIAYVVLQYLIIVVIVAFLPCIESIFYRGTFHISSTIYIFLGILLLIKSYRKIER